MISSRVAAPRHVTKASLAVFALLAGAAAHAQDTEHHRKGYKPLPDLAVVTVHVEKGFNGKPLENAAVIFHATRDGRDDGNLEVKTSPEGDARIDLLEVGSDVQLQVIADGYATYAAEFMVDAATKDLNVKMLRPRAQVSAYVDTDGQASQRPLGVQEPPHNEKARAGAVKGGSFSGTLRDASGARIPGGIVRIQQLAASVAGSASTPGMPSAQGIALGDHAVPADSTVAPVALVTTSTYSDASGNFRKRDLPAGRYNVEITAPGFQTQRYRDVVLVNGDDHVFDKPLLVAPATAATETPKP